ncbi:MAG: 2Fe-2S iron-sulfur cluster binding domain-containing protein [Saprospiraceae bacterium]|nr:2Fe-2S iron-sulfur cluster binding domain-containing protein [Saprospiraceae bacterium]
MIHKQSQFRARIGTPPNHQHASVVYSSINQEVRATDESSTLLDISMENKIPHLHECGGNGKCTTCRVRIIEGHRNLSSRTKIEKNTAHLRKWDPSIRLACQFYVQGDVQVQRLVWSSAEVNKLQLETIPEGEAEERNIVILFCDLRNFTRITSENMVFDIAHMLNRFYTVLGDPILMNNGIIYQYVGDEIVGIFGTSGGTRQKNTMDAVRAALGMQYAIERLNHFELKDFETKFEIGIGLNYGRAFIGHLGHPKHRQFTVVGDPVNVASRIQGCTKETQAKTLISKSILEGLPAGTIEIGRTFSKHLAGKEAPFELYELKGFVGADIYLELQSSLDFVLKNELGFAQRFYKKVFEKAPGLRPLFRDDMSGQERLLTHMLGGIVYSLSRPEYLKMGLRTLGRSHEKYGVKPEHYPLVKQLLIETIEEELGEFHTEKLSEAWRQALDFVTSEMMNWKKSK